MTEVDRIRKALRGTRMPKWVARTQVELIEDAAGETAAVVQVVVRAGSDAVLRDGNALDGVRAKVHEALRSAGVGLWPYVRFEAESEAA